MGETVAWIIGWALIMEYALGAATVSIAWSEYLNSLFGGRIPYEWCHSPFQIDPITGVHGILNAPAVGILFLLSLLLIRGTEESAFVNAIIVFIKVAIVIVFIFIGWRFIDPANHATYTIPAGTPGHESFRQHGWGGILGGAGIVFFAFIGFDAVSTAAQEAKNPKRDMPIGIIGSLIVCTILYVLFSHVLTGVANWKEFALAGKEASVGYAIEHHMPGFMWLATAVKIGILAGFSSVILVMLMGQSRVFYSMSNDGLLPKVFSDLHPKYRTPFKSNLILFIFVGLFAAFVPSDIVGDLTSFGTLFAFILVCAGIWMLRRSDPNTPRPFKTPLVPLVPILGILVCGAMISQLNPQTLKVAIIWMALGLVVYFIYGRKHSKLNNE
jgi:APA family basic amino acid/polyamine antiporter